MRAIAFLLAGALLGGCAVVHRDQRAAAAVAPRPLQVSPGQHPPPGSCRVWYPGRPPGRQPTPVPCETLVVAPGTFLLYEGRAWDVDYDWRSHERRYPGTVPQVVIDVIARR
jgi:hypothetical protein